MEKILFDSGIKEYQIGSGVLRFNPSDPNVYARFVNSMKDIRAVEGKLIAKAQKMQKANSATGKSVLELMAEADRDVKGILNRVFGGNNDFNEILGGCNVMAVADNGERVITNLLNALQPIMVAGAQRCAQEQAGAATAKAQTNRDQRRAQMKVKK